MANLINWFKNKIIFLNGSLPAINDINLNEMQNKIEQDISDFVQGDLHNYISGMPIGSGCDYFGAVAPDNYMFADGSEISRTDYAELFEIIGETYGAGDGSTTFNLPDKRERVSVMYKEDSTDGTDGATLSTLGAKGGEFKHTLTKAELPAIQLQGTYDGVNLTMNPEGYSVFKMYGSNKGNLLTENLGSGHAMNNMQPYLVCNYIIKVK